MKGPSGDDDGGGTGLTLSAGLVAFLEAQKMEWVGPSLATLNITTVFDLSQFTPEQLTEKTEMKLLQARRLLGESSAALLVTSKGAGATGATSAAAPASSILALAGEGLAVSKDVSYGDDDDAEVVEARAMIVMEAQRDHHGGASVSGALIAEGRLGVLLLDRGRCQEALNCFERAAQGLATLHAEDKHPDTLAARGNRGLALMELGRLDDAGKCVSKKARTVVLLVLR